MGREHANLVLSRGGRCLAIGQQRSDVLNREAGIGAVEPDGRIVVVQSPLIERLGVLCDRGWRRADDVWKNASKMYAPLSAKSWIYFSMSPSKIVKKPK